MTNSRARDGKRTVLGPEQVREAVFNEHVTDAASQRATLGQVGVAAQ